MKDHAVIVTNAEPQTDNVHKLNDLSIHKADGQLSAATSVIVKTYDSDSDNEKPILLELGSTPSNASSIAINSNTTTTITTTSDMGVNPSYPVGEYPLDMHLNTYGLSAHYNMGGTDGPTFTTLYSNPYLESLSSSALSLPPGGFPALSSSLHSPTSLTASYPGHIPQTVYTWTTAAHAPNELDLAKMSPTEMVPAPIYMSYADEQEHLINKELNPSWKDKVMQSEKDYKKTACDRERTRMRDMNRAFDMLRSKLPISKPNGKKYSKIESLRIAINYINHLQQCLDESDPSSVYYKSTDDNTRQNAIEYLRELSMRRRSKTYGYETRKSRSSSYDDTNDKDSVDDSHNSSWNDDFSTCEIKCPLNAKETQHLS